MVRQLWSQFIPRISRRQLLPPPPSPPAKLSIPKLSKVRDRLARLWTSSVVDGLVAVSQQEGIRWLSIPGVDAGVDDAFAVRIPIDQADDAVRRIGQRISSSITTGDLYWVSGEYTTLAVKAAASLPEFTLTEEDLPSPHGLLVWQLPVTQVITRGVGVTIVAATWTAAPGGVWVCFYTQPEQYTNIDREALREQIGWLMPFGFGGLLRFNANFPSSAFDSYPLAPPVRYLAADQTAGTDGNHQPHPGYRESTKNLQQIAPAYADDSGC